jgi:DNA-binding MarR family transcriptional regulator
VADRVHSAAIHLLRRLRKQDAALGLSPARASALSVLVFGGPLTIGQLAQAEQVRAPTMTRLVIGLEAERLVTRRRDRDDGRVVWIHPTPKGTRILRKGRVCRVNALRLELEGMAPRDVVVLARAARLMEDIARRPAPGEG